MEIEEFLSYFLIVTYFAFIIFYVYIVIRYSRMDFIKKLKKRYFRAIISVLDNTENEEDCIKQLNLDFKKMSELHSSFSSEIKTSVSLLEEIILEIDTLNGNKFEKRYGIKVTNDIRNQIVKIVEIMRDQNPFISISSKGANLLINLNQAIETGNKDFGHTILKQLSDEIEMLENNVTIQHNRNKNSY